MAARPYNNCSSCMPRSPGARGRRRRRRSRRARRGRLEGEAARHKAVWVLGCSVGHAIPDLVCDSLGGGAAGVAPAKGQGNRAVPAHQVALRVESVEQVQMWGVGHSPALVVLHWGLSLSQQAGMSWRAAQGTQLGWGWLKGTGKCPINR